MQDKFFFERLSKIRGGVKLRKRDLLIIPVMIGVVMFSHVTEEPKVQANQVNDYIPYYATEEYQRIKQMDILELYERVKSYQDVNSLICVSISDLFSQLHSVSINAW